MLWNLNYSINLHKALFVIFFNKHIVHFIKKFFIACDITT